jgi:uncharacterized membrane protein
MNQTGKTPNKKIVWTLAAIITILIIGLNISIIFYYSEMNNKNTQIQQLNNQITDIQALINNQTLTPATTKLISVGMQYTDNRTDPNAPFLLVTGYVVNVGTSTATNCTIYVSAIQNGNSTAIDNSASIKTLEPGTFERIDIQFPYTGQPVVAYTANLKWSP